MGDFVDSGPGAYPIGSSDLVWLRKSIKSCESVIFWLMSRVHGRQKIADVNLHKTTDGVGGWWLETGGAV